MDDRQLLEAAAKAADIELADSPFLHTRKKIGALTAEGRIWNPLADDGDAFSLSCALGISLEFGNDKVEASGGGSWVKVRYTDRPDGSYTDDERRAAARRAIVRAAASRAKGV